ncbi:GNAT family N-acetyltransferase [Paenibacillus thiaminolyticus]|uniref:N-acetyltransferase n=1 Tax=Paenibacillus thiaminolyticus TaxID=49283 RepID=A0A3A3GN88_PANTH|nr:GNAT family N-acetyltransferase [Paenibacillus thiaminolyticus]RJG26545.1 N-acetyltransferase [Paenibacillus thiaminolyticus]
MKVLETDRPVLCWLSTDDAEFMLELLNTPSWLEFIGDKGVRTVEAARDYILNGPVEMYVRLGFGLYLIERKTDGVPLGICGLMKRDTLEDVDIGYAFLPRHWGNGYAYESASALLTHGKNILRLPRIVAITSPSNQRSAKLLEKLGLHFDSMVTISNDGRDLKLYG